MSSPDLSVVLVAPNGMGSIRRTMACLRAQTARERLEVLVVAPSAELLDLDALGRDRFAALRAVEVGPITQRGEAAAVAVREATAPIVAFVEDHSFPRPGWAEAFLDAHAGGDWAAVGPRVHNANADAPLSVANFVLTYASTSGPQEAGPRSLLAFHNSAYRRDLLLAYGDRLGPLLEWEGDLQDDLMAQGRQLYLEPRAETDHLNVSGMRSTIRLHLLRGRMMGGDRATRERWPVWKRALYVAGAPLFPLMQWRHVAPEIRRWGLGTAERVRLAPWLALVLGAAAVGEAAGYLLGPGRARDRWQSFELYRTRHLSRKERRQRAAATEG
ncbi:hypothetical protein [Rubrivirga sp.]|uniref:hypothetical protein n=1 Tax=Rubrivirga sp. TaxID=1885344 RepID=UPI003B51D261